ncbi:MAG: PilC/PilY family type IV pilus protein [Candidatus Contendobacter sp.]
MKAKMPRSYKLAVAAALLSGGLFPYGWAQAAQLSISPIPLFIGATGVAPNVFFTLDDSGSMDWEFSALRYWEANFYDFDIGVGNTSSAAPTDYAPDSQQRWTGFTADSGSTSYSAGSVSNYLSYYYPNSDNLYTPTTGCEVGRGANNGAIFSCNQQYTLWRPDRRCATPTAIDLSSTTTCPAYNASNPHILWDWRLFSADVNTLYYNPALQYDPWDSIGTNASYTAVRSNPMSGTTGYTVTRDLSATDFYYAVWTDNKGFAGTAPGRGSNAASDSTSMTNGHMTGTPNGIADLWDNYTLYTVKAGATTNTITVQVFQTQTCKTESPAPGNKTNLTGVTGTSVDANDPRCWYYQSTAPNYVYQAGRLVVSLNSTLPDITDAAAVAAIKQNIANWYQYYRRRSLVAKGSIGKVVTGFPNFRYGISVLNQWSGNWPGNLFIEMPSAATPPFTTENANLLSKTYGFTWQANGTPLQIALDRAGQYYKGTLSGYSGKSPILPAEQGGECQQNFSLLITDGFWNAAYGAMNDKDGDGRNNTLADVAYNYYKNDLRTDLANKVLTTPFDQANWQHMVDFTVAFGVEGFLNYPTASGWPAEVTTPAGNLEASTQWGDPSASTTTPAKVDDLWHAAYNSRGAFVSAKSPQELLDGLRNALSIVSSRVGSAMALSMNAGFVTNSKTSTAYLARFNSADWTGQMLAVTIKSDGTFDTGAPVWDTGSSSSAFATKTPSDRKIFTRTSTGGVEFLWANLDTAQQNALNTNPTSGTPCSATNLTACDGKGSERLEFLRGKGVAAADSTWLTNNGFRTRSSMLGDIINSDPFFVDGSPPMVYVGANDGMLHAFNANTGAELFAYVPNAVFKRLNAIPGKNYAHNYTVDGSVVVKEINGKKILVGTLRGGGQAVYALDVTNPTSFSASKVLWEYSDNDLGYTFSKPTIAKLANGTWAVFLGNGYNNTEADGSASTTGYAYLYILKMDSNGALVTPVTPISTGAGSATTPNGLATPAIIFDPSDPSKVKYAYAGDLLGNLWKFDVNAGNLAYKLFTARSPDSGNPVQPITTRPEVNLHPSRGYLVYFGTGKYFETGDNSTTNPTQTLYAVWDRAWGEKTGDTPSAPGTLVPQTRADLLQQTITANVGGSYVTSNTPIAWYATLSSKPSLSPSSPPTYLGWYVDLTFGGNNRGEKQVTNGLLYDNKVIFNTIIPSAGLCDAGGTSNTIMLDAISGSRLKTSPFKGTPLVDDDNNPNTPAVPVSSKPSNAGILSEPQIVRNLQTGEDYIVSLGSSGEPVSTGSDPSQQTLGRQFWRQLQQ